VKQSFEIATLVRHSATARRHVALAFRNDGSTEPKSAFFYTLRLLINACLSSQDIYHEQD